MIIGQGPEPKSVWLRSWSLCRFSRNYFADVPKKWSDLPEITQLVGTETGIQIYSSPNPKSGTAHDTMLCSPGTKASPLSVPSPSLQSPCCLNPSVDGLETCPDSSHSFPWWLLLGSVPADGRDLPHRWQIPAWFQRMPTGVPLQALLPLRLRSKLTQSLSCYPRSLKVPCS